MARAAPPPSSVDADRGPWEAPRHLPAPSSPFWRRLALIGAAAFVVRVAYVLGAKRHDALQGDAIYYSGQARVIAHGHWFHDPFLPHRQAADHPPLTSLVLAPAEWVAPGSVLAQRLLMAAIGAAAVVLIGLLARRVDGDRTAVVAAGLAAVYANLWINDGLTMSETVSAVAVALALLAAYRFAASPGTRAALVLGLACGVAVLARAEMILLVPLVVVPLALLARVPVRTRVVSAALAVLVVVVVQAPWVGYNLARFERPVLFSTNEGLTYVGANCPATYDGPALGFWSLQCAEAAGSPENLDQSEVSNRYRRIGLGYARDHLERVPVVVLARVGRVWSLYRPGQMAWLNTGEGREQWASTIGVWSFWTLAPAAVAGGVLLHRRRRLLVPLLALPVIVTVVAAWFYGIVRFRLPAEITVVVLAAVTIERLMVIGGRGVRPRLGAPGD